MDKFLEDWEAEASARPGNEFLEVDFAHRADGVELVGLVSLEEMWCWTCGIMLTSAELASYLVR